MTGVPIRLERCAKTFKDGTRALEPLDLEIRGGETLAILGPSGCGKTTTLRLIAGLEPPDPGGRVLFGDEDVTAKPIEQRNVGMVFQSYALFPNLNVAENIGYGLRVRNASTTDVKRRVDEMLAMMQIAPLAERRIDQLSGGQKQRVALARAIAVRPRVLLLDEPLTALDAKLRDQLRIDIDALLRGLNITSVYVTHDQAEAMALGDRIVVMNHGTVAQIGTPREIYRRPTSDFVAEFIGTMNRLDGHMENGWFVCKGGRLQWPAADGAKPELLFRPNDATIAADGAGALRGIVRTALYLGGHTRLVVDDVAARPVIIETALKRDFVKGRAISFDVDAAALVNL